MSIVMTNYLANFDAAFKASVRVSRYRTEKTALERVLNFIDKVNYAPEHASGIGEVSFSEMTIPTAFASFIYPASVKVDSTDRLAKDLRDRTGYPFIPGKNGAYNEPRFTYEDWNDVANTMYEICGQYKVSDPELVTVSELRKHVNLSDIADRVAAEGMCRSTAKVRYVPVPVIDAVKLLWRDAAWNEEMKLVFNEYLVHELKNLFK